MSSPTNGISHDITIREVGANNCREEFALIRDTVETYHHVAMAIKYPSVVAHCVGAFDSPFDHEYQTLRDNVNVVRPIQIGLTFFDTDGHLPFGGGGCGCIWQFNILEFDVDADIADHHAVELLRGHGVDFAKHREQGIGACDFGEFLMSSGAVLKDSDVEWITLDGGHDIGFLLRILTGRVLPETREEFFELVNIFFPTLYDVKHLTICCDDLDGGLVQVAELLGVENVGVRHQAGWDSLLTARMFRMMKERYLDGSIEQYSGSLYGLNINN
ncbi:putative CCR4-associated factor 1 [Cocos nucifera]|uniref:poly(A)-specific ribonuclease n=1 Tax=Cocos nucifera TaxID=13894 RepID=A0A8K0IHI4_COCNU|nr:putative CCR4-associated factor 1 [Cocos nucifera]